MFHRKLSFRSAALTLGSLGLAGISYGQPDDPGAIELQEEAIEEQREELNQEPEQQQEQQQEQQNSQQQEQQRQQQESEQQAKNRTQTAPILVFTTVGFAEGNGCWATIYSDEYYLGRSLTLAGNTTYSNLEFGIGQDWEGDVESLVMGPNARLYAYGEEGQEDVDHVYGPNDVDADVANRPWWDDIESLRLECVK